jgi:hypothetical protein
VEEEPLVHQVLLKETMHLTLQLKKHLGPGCHDQMTRGRGNPRSVCLTCLPSGLLHINSISIRVGLGVDSNQIHYLLTRFFIVTIE